ncbi:MAG: hypothetical protein EKK55_25000 [Rhodocyclaceae bacterium]|nr:MAG: hypothetical protein EKK55_25000 [Rhodocyclaceae bacterium]
MARHLGRGEALSATNPQLDAFTLNDGTLADPFSLTFEVLDVSDAEKRGTPVQVAAPTAVNLTADKVGLGHFAASWTVPSTASLGRHFIVWRMVLVEGGPVVEWAQPFDVVGSRLLVPRGVELLALVSDVRAEGVPAATEDGRILEQISTASRELVQWTGRPSFTPQARTVALDAPDARALLLDEAVIAVESISIGDRPLPLSAFVVYNRQVRGLTGEDDRDNPKIELRESASTIDEWSWRWPTTWEGFVLRSSIKQKVVVKGVWGYTEADGSPAGGTPAMARYVVVRMALRTLPKQGRSGAQAERDGHLVTNLRTREQSISWARPVNTAYAGLATFTGDPDIDGKILRLQRPFGGAMA